MPTIGTDHLRVVFVTHNYPRHPGDVAGAFLHPLALALRDLGLDVRVVAPSDRGAGGRDLLDGIPVRRVRYASPARERYAYTGTMADAARSPGGLLALWRLVRALRAGARAEAAGAAQVVVHAHWWLPGGLAAPPELPLVCTCHGTDVRLLDRGPLVRWLARGPLRRAEVVTTVSSPFAARLTRQAGVVIPSEAIQPMPVASVARPRSSGGGGVVMLGRLTAQKRVTLGIQAWATARAAGLALPLTIIGDGPERGAVESAIAALPDRDAVRLLGEIPPDAVPGALAHADLLLMPARAEGLGLAAAEALMQGIPVVACADGGGVLDVVPATGAGRVAAPEPAALAAAMRDLHADPAAGEAAAALGADWAARLAPPFVAERALGWYRRALDG